MDGLWNRVSMRRRWERDFKISHSSSAALDPHVPNELGRSHNLWATQSECDTNFKQKNGKNFKYTSLFPILARHAFSLTLYRQGPPPPAWLRAKPGSILRCRLMECCSSARLMPRATSNKKERLKK